ncbi:MAG: DUF4838 domain-containing protein [Candidatus Hydrogenedentes bacterium]|nr:DUF4838 domain-containing protein [Candidatus Hydrogenedentota bacterium]
MGTFRFGVAVFLLALMVASTGWAAEERVLVDAGRSDYRIVVGAEADPAERHAAAELQRFLREISGVELAIEDDRETPQDHEILVGRSQRLDSLGLGVDWAALGSDGYVKQTLGSRLILAGGAPRGTLYAVYGLLEDELNCRWFTPTVSRVPQQARIAVPSLARQELPAMAYRSMSWTPVADADWAVRNRVNVAGGLDAARGGTTLAVGGGHSMLALVPPEEFFASHPEYFSEIAGRRTNQKAQLCFTNPDVVRIASERVLQWLRKQPEAKLAWVAQMDWGGWCECVNCRAVSDREGGPTGPMLEFVNRVAEIVEPEYPDVMVATYAYQDTRKPPKTVAPRKNVLVMVCPIECCYSHPVATCELNASFMNDLAGWARLTEKFYLFDYTGNFDHYVMPQPNLRVLQPNIQLYRGNHVKGIFALGNPGPGSEFGDLRGYLLAKLMWNPDVDLAHAQEEFLAAVYGTAADPIQRYIDLLHDKVEREQIHCGISASPMLPHLAPEMMAQASALFDEAERLAEDETLRERVRLARLPVQHIQLEWMKPRYRVVGDAYKPGDVGPAVALAQEFVAVAERNGVTQISEGVPSSWHTERLALWSVPFAAVRLENPELRVDVVPGLGGRIVSIFHKDSGQELLLEAQPDGREYPRSAGYEEYSERGWRSHGCMEAFDHHVSRPGLEVTLECLLSNGLKMQRTLTLDASRAELSVDSRLVNVSTEPKAACLRIHPMFSLGATEDVAVSYTDGNGAAHEVTLIKPEGKLRGQHFLRGEERPAGHWQGVNRKSGLGIGQDFDLAQVEECLLDWLPDRKRFNLEIASAEQTLAPGESVALRHSYSVFSRVFKGL